MSETITVDFIADLRCGDQRSINAWSMNQNQKHFDRMVDKHGAENVVGCEMCWRGVLKTKAIQLGEVTLGPTCYKRHKDALEKGS